MRERERERERLILIPLQIEEEAAMVLKLFCEKKMKRRERMWERDVIRGGNGDLSLLDECRPAL